jgi:hypothetical protein
MNPRTSMVDRLLLLVLAVVLMLGGVWLALWSRGQLPAGWWSPSGFTTGLDDAVTGADWWPSALLLGGLLIAVLGLFWLASHFRRNSVGVLTLPGGDRGGRLTLDGSALSSGAAAALAGSPEVSSASGRLVEDKHGVVLALTATIAAHADLREVADACDEVAAHVLRSTGRQDLTCRVRAKVATRARRSPRVR